MTRPDDALPRTPARLAEDDHDLDQRAGRSPAASPFPGARRSRRPRLRPDVVAAVFAGGCAGGFARYAVTDGWPTPVDRFPWSTLVVNVAGAFVLAVVMVLAVEVAPSRYLRPLLGTGFCGALTTFSSVVVSADQLFAHHHPDAAVAYLVASMVGGLGAAVLGLVAGRAVEAQHRVARDERSTS